MNSKALLNQELRSFVLNIAIILNSLLPQKRTSFNALERYILEYGQDCLEKSKLFKAISSENLPKTQFPQNISISELTLIYTYLHAALSLTNSLDSTPKVIDSTISSDENSLNIWNIISNNLTWERTDAYEDVDPVWLFLEPPDFIREKAFSLIKKQPQAAKERKVLKGLETPVYEHPKDRSALEKLKSIKGIDWVITKINEYGYERAVRIDNLSSNCRVTQDQFPSLYKVFSECVEILDITQPPELFLETGFINAATFGVTQPQIVLMSGAISLLSEDELRFIIGHELGHIKSQHVLYQQIAALFPVFSEIIGDMTLGLGGLAAKVLEIPLYDWERKSELTADRAGLLCCQNPQASLSALMKLAGVPYAFYNQINLDEFLRQAEEFNSLDSNTLDKAYKFFKKMGMSHPWVVIRVKELHDWITDGAYELTLNQTNKQQFSGSIEVICPKCGTEIEVVGNFCHECGMPLEKNAGLNL